MTQTNKSKVARLVFHDKMFFYRNNMFWQYTSLIKNGSFLAEQKLVADIILLAGSRCLNVIDLKLYIAK